MLQEESGPIQRWVFPPDAPEGIDDRIPGIYTLVADRILNAVLAGNECCVRFIKTLISSVKIGNLRYQSSSIKRS
jgi:hypothetical protein